MSLKMFKTGEIQKEHFMLIFELQTEWYGELL